MEIETENQIENQTEPIEINIFDNDQSILYKWYNRYQVPVKYLIAVNTSVSDQELESLRNTDDYDNVLDNIFDNIVPIDFTYSPISELSFEPLANRILFLSSCELSLTNIYNIISFSKGYFIQDITNSSVVAGSSRYKLDYEIALLFMSIFATNYSLFNEKDLFSLIKEYFNDLNSTYNIDNITLLNLHYGEWIDNYNKLNISDQKNSDNIIGIQDLLVQKEPLVSSEVNVTGITLQFKPLFNHDKIPSSDDGIELFDKANLSSFVPYVQLNNFKDDYISDDTYYKVYTGNSLDKTNYSFVIPNQEIEKEKDKVAKPSHLYLTLWTGINEDLTKSSKKLYETVSYDLKNNNLVIKIPITQPNIVENQKIFVDRIASSLPVIISSSEGGGKEIRAIANFTIYDLEIVSTVLLQLILNEPLFNNYLYIEESIIAFADKERLDIHFKSIQGSFDTLDVEANDESLSVNSSLTAILVQDFLVADTTVTIDEQSTTFVKGTPVTQIRVTKSTSIQLIKDFELILVRLMAHYKAETKGIEGLYLTYFPQTKFQPQTQPQTLKDKQIVKARNVSGTKLSQLKDLAPQIFIAGYARQGCQVGQPSNIGSDEVEAWTNETFMFNGRTYNRQVLPFPPNEPFLNLICPYEDRPFPGIKENKLNNNVQFPYLPCCYKENHMDPHANSRYNEVYNNKEIFRKEITAKSHKLGIDKIVGPSRIGALTPDIIDLLSINLPLLLEQNKSLSKTLSEGKAKTGRKPKEQPYELNFYRYGVIVSPNSLLHCLNIAINNSDYLDQSSDEDKEEYVVQQRLALSSFYQPSLLKQELYDFDDQQILDQLNDPNIFLDPSLFYRMLEEYFNVNIFTFKIIANGHNHVGAIDYPRCKIFHANALRIDRFSVCIVKHWGSLSNQTKSYPHCELIVTTDNQDNIVNTTFKEEMTQFLYDTMNNTQKVITWLPQEGSLVAIENLYSAENYVSFIEPIGKIKQQIIDLYGKLRGFIVEPSFQGYSSFTFMFPPSRPENYPLATETVRGSMGLVMAINSNNNPTSYTLDSNELIDGIWYASGDIIDLIYYPILATEEDTKTFKDKYPGVEKGPIYYIVNTDVSEIKRVENLNRNNLLILHLIIWLYLLSEMEVEDFINTVLYIDNSGAESSTIYNFNELERRLPEDVDFSQALLYLFNRGTKLIINKQSKVYQIYLYSPKYAEGIIYFLRTYDSTHKDLRVRIPKILDDYYLYPSNFKTQPSVLNFIGYDNLQNWIKSLELNGENQYLIKKALLPSLAKEVNPYLYEAEEITYLIQNTQSGSLLAAINISYNWFISLINPGYYSVDYLNKPLPNYVVFNISNNELVASIENPRDQAIFDSGSYLSVLRYSQNTFAAILQLE